MRLIKAMLFFVVLSLQVVIAGSLQIVVDSIQWLPPNLQDSLQIKLRPYIKDFPVDILVAVLADTTNESAFERISNISKGKKFMTVLVLPQIKNAMIIPHPSIKDTYKLDQVQEQVLKPIVFAGGYYYGIYSALLLLGQTPPEVDTNVITRELSYQNDTAKIDSNIHETKNTQEVNTEALLSPRNISRAIAIIVTILVAYLSWRRWREYKTKQDSTTEQK